MVEIKEKLIPKPATSTISTPTEIASLEIATPTQEIEKKEIPPAQKITFNLTKFAALKYTPLLNGIIYFTLTFLIFSLTLTIYFDIFVYRKFVIDYKELIPRWLSFCLILVIFLYLDQTKLIQIIPHQLIIHGF
jgi:hypothetical protein